MARYKHNLVAQSMIKDVKVGDMVRLGVWVCGEWQPMFLGKITRIERPGHIEADVMGIHGGEPWIHSCRSFHYMLELEFQKLKQAVLITRETAVDGAYA